MSHLVIKYLLTMILKMSFGLIFLDKVNPFCMTVPVGINDNRTKDEIIQEHLASKFHEIQTPTRSRLPETNFFTHAFPLHFIGGIADPTSKDRPILLKEFQVWKHLLQYAIWSAEKKQFIYGREQSFCFYTF